MAITLFLSPIALMPACSQPSRICELVCECEHCNDLTDDFSCERISSSQEIAEIYECGDQWTSYADCFEDKGTCDEDRARFSTREQGSCSATSSSGLACMNNTDCLTLGIDGARCEMDVCVFTSCAGDMNGQPCQTNADCPGGDDKCQSELEELNKCLIDAADDPSFINIGFN